MKLANVFLFTLLAVATVAAPFAVGIYALTQLDTDTAFKAAMAWVAGIGIAYPYNAKFNWFDTYKVKYPMHYVPELLMVGLLGAGYIANQAE